MFKGCSTALVTPMSADGSIDHGGLEQLVEFQIANNIQAVLAVGTTGESPTLLWEEHNEVIDRTVALAKGRTPIDRRHGQQLHQGDHGGQRARRPHWRGRRAFGRSLLQWAQLLGDPPRIRRAGGAGLSRGANHSLHHPRAHRLYDAGGRFGHSRPTSIPTWPKSKRRPAIWTTWPRHAGSAATILPSSQATTTRPCR